MILRRIMRPSLETDAIFDAALSVNSHMVLGWVSAMAVTHVCDEKRAGTGAAFVLTFTRRPDWCE